MEQIIPNLNDNIYLFNPIGSFNKPCWLNTTVTEINREQDYFETDGSITYKDENGVVNKANRFSLSCHQILWFDHISKLPSIDAHWNKLFIKENISGRNSK